MTVQYTVLRDVSEYQIKPPLGEFSSAIEYVDGFPCVVIFKNGVEVLKARLSEFSAGMQPNILYEA